MLSFGPAQAFSGCWDHRPAVPSPLSSSPLRASSPLSPVHENTLAQRQTQSSPIQPPRFKYASRPARPNPVMRRREEAQESRRRGFLQGVRQKADDKAWQRRDIEGQFLKTSWLADRGRLARDAPALTEADIDDAMEFEGDAQRPRHDDERAVDATADDDELEAMLASYEEQQLASPPRPASPTASDEEYDDIFAELISQEQPQPAACPNSWDQMDMS